MHIFMVESCRPCSWPHGCHSHCIRIKSESMMAYPHPKHLVPSHLSFGLCTYSAVIRAYSRLCALESILRLLSGSYAVQNLHMKNNYFNPYLYHIWYFGFVLFCGGTPGITQGLLLVVYLGITLGRI